jgi:hypothetical protein
VTPISGRLFRQTLGVAGLQGLQMLISATIGFAIIRTMSKADYALFSLLNMGMATFAGWVSVPITTIFIPYANRLGATVNLRSATALFRRNCRPFELLALPVALGLLGISAARNDWLSPLYTVAMGLCLFAGWLQYRYAYCLAQLRQLGWPVAAMRANVISELMRLACVLPIVLLAARSVRGDELMALMMVPAIAAGMLCFSYLKRSHPEVLVDGALAMPLSPAARTAFWELLRPIVFSQYFFLAMQLVKTSLIYLISPTDIMAEVAALGRLMLLLALIDKTVDYMVLPLLGRSESHHRFMRLFGASFAILAGALALLCLSVYVFPGAWLWILGGAYQNLNGAVLIAAVAACIERLSGFIMFGMFARGMTRNQWWVPLVCFSAYFTTIYRFGLDTTLHATWSLLAYALAHLCCQLAIAVRTFRNSPATA